METDKGLGTIPKDLTRTGAFSCRLGILALVFSLLFTSSLKALPTVVVNGTTLTMSNVNVVVQYHLNTGKANFYWQNSLKISGFYAGYQLTSYITGTAYSVRTYSVSNNTVTITATGTGLQTMKQYFIFDANDSFLTRLELDGVGLKSDWMGPVVVDTSGYVDIGSYGDDRALYVPFDNDSFTRYNAMPINSSDTGYEVGAFYDNVSRNGLVVGSVTHDTWKTGVYWLGSSSNKLVNLNVFGGVTSSQTRDVMPHGQVVGNAISSPTVFVGFGLDWRTVMDNFANENTNQVPRRVWNGGVPFGWNSWYGIGSSINYGDAVDVSYFINSNLQSNNFNNNGAVYVNLDSYWDNMNGSQLQYFANLCYANGQNPGIYWAPFVWWGAASNAATSLVQGSSYYYSDIALKTTNGNYQTIDGAIALDPTHPGTKQRIDYYINMFKGYGFDYLKLDFLTHGALEGVHYDTNVTTGIQAYNQGMQYLLNDMGTNMYCSESIAPIFPYQYGHSRRIACDTSTYISETSYQMQSVTYGWWLSGQLYQYNDPDCMKFSGATTNENQSRLISCAISGTVFLNSDDLTTSGAQALAETCLTNASINAVARAGQSFIPVEGNTGTNAGTLFVRQDGTTWCVAVFNYTSSSVTTNINLARAGIAGSYVPVDLWSGAVSHITNATLTVNLNAKQSKLFRLFTAPRWITPVAETGGVISFTLQGDAGYNYAIQSTTNLVQWNTVATLTNTTGQMQFTQTNLSSFGNHFFRAMLVQ
jgi:Alpha galactosidase C-terminal beta sandwich domain